MPLIEKDKLDLNQIKRVLKIFWGKALKTPQNSANNEEVSVSFHWVGRSI